MHIPTYLLALHDFRPLFHSPKCNGENFATKNLYWLLRVLKVQIPILCQGAHPIIIIKEAQNAAL